MKPLTEIQKRAAELSIAGVSRDEIAKVVGRKPTTIDTWRALPEFQEYCKKLQSESQKRDIEEVAETLQRLRRKAFKRVEEILDDDENPARIHLQACSLVAKMCGLDGNENRAANDMLQLLINLKSEVSETSYDEITSAIAGRFGG